MCIINKVLNIIFYYHCLKVRLRLQLLRDISWVKSSHSNSNPCVRKKPANCEFISQNCKKKLRYNRTIARKKKPELWDKCPKRCLFFKRPMSQLSFFIPWWKQASLNMRKIWVSKKVNWLGPNKSIILCGVRRTSHMHYCLSHFSV